VIEKQKLLMQLTTLSEKKIYENLQSSADDEVAKRVLWNTRGDRHRNDDDRFVHVTSRHVVQAVDSAHTVESE
jgi:hypothetical protein